MRTVKGQGSYTRKVDGSDVSYDFEYRVVEDISDLPEGEIIALVNRMLKVDGNNTSREKAKSVNGDSTARIMTAEEKEANKVKAKAGRDFDKALRARGINVSTMSPDALSAILEKLAG